MFLIIVDYFSRLTINYQFSAPGKIGFAQNDIFGLSTAVFAEIPADSIWLSANCIGISIKTCEILAQNENNDSKNRS
jgi:hypothetical protein